MLPVYTLHTGIMPALRPPCPKPEVRNPKEIRNPRSEGTSTLSLNFRWVGVPGLRLKFFGSRISGFLRPSEFSFRISPATSPPAKGIEVTARTCRSGVSARVAGGELRAVQGRPA